MLARAARRRLRRDGLHVQTHLALPWLCPAAMRWTASVATQKNQASLPLPRRTAALSPRHETRSLATAVELQSSPPPGVLPFHAWGSRRPDPQLSRLPDWTGVKPLVVHEATSEMAPPTRTKFGIGGDPAELHQNLYACLRVGRLDRATAIVQRLSEIYNPTEPELVDAHNRYLQATFELALDAQDQSRSEAMAKVEHWYSAEMVRKMIEPNAQTFVVLLRASMNLLDNSEREGAIQKYLSLAYEQGEGVLEDVNASPEFSDEEWDTLIRFQPDTFDEPPAVEEVQDLQMSTPAGQALAIQHGLIQAPKPDVNPVSQKGLGLRTLKHALRSFDTTEKVAYPHEMEGTQEEKDLAYAYMRQVRLEQDATEAATQRWKAEDEKLQEMGIHGVLQSKSLQALMWNWYTALRPLLEEELKATKEVLGNPSKENEKDSRHVYGPYLEQCPPAKLAAVAISRLVISCAQGRREDVSALKVSSLSMNISRDMEDELNRNVKSRHKAFLRKTRSLARKELLGKLSKKKMESRAEGAAQSSVKIANTFQQQHFPPNAKAKIGAMVLERLMASAMITVAREDPKTGKKLTSTQRAFLHHVSFAKGKKIGYVRPHYEINVKLRSDPVHNVQTMKLPMLVEPKPWSALDEGGYYIINEQAVRTKASDVNQQAYVTSAIENGDMKKVLAGLDVLGKVPWNVNGDVFKVMVEAWNTDENIGGLASEKDTSTPPVEPPSDASYDVRHKWTQAMKTYENVKSGLHSVRCFQNFQLEVARAFLNEKFYYPHSVDFRGRAYPCPPILNHIGADIARGLLRFANGKELGTVGLQWMRIHLANLYGYDKASLKDREQFAIDHVEDIYDSATNPLKGNRWWAKAEDPWQCLACCVELKNALESPDPTRFVSHLPVHQDGTCNGLQHYAALGGDKAGASQVNLEPSDRPQDIYTGVADLVRSMVSEDAKKGNLYAAVVLEKISRKVVKRTVMTNVYGVTFVGAKLQVLAELEAIWPQGSPHPDIPHLSMIAMYVAKKIFVALGQIFNGAQDIQYWLGECGSRITKSMSAEQIRKIQERAAGAPERYDPKYKTSKTLSGPLQKKLNEANQILKTSIVWTTPLKMPVVQPYRKDKKERIVTSLQGISVVKHSGVEAVDRRKQLAAFPPNFIHSLDASHMLLSALKCAELNLDFAAVHDSFWTHAADIPNLNIVLRDAFVRMHSEDIIGRLAAEFKARYAGSMYHATIYSDTPVGRAIQEWRRDYRQANAKARATGTDYAELALEADRQDLLSSEDPALRKKGEAMVTPVSIWLQHQDPLALVSHNPALLGQDRKPQLQKNEVRERLLGAEAEVLKDEAHQAGEQLASTELDKREQHEAAEEQGHAEEVKETAESNDVELELEAEDAAEAEAEAKKGRFSFKVWLPLTFPPVPKKGDWDVKRLRDSKYFFS
ncbi:DNA-directed RNA polymerase mitochondrial precursor [Lophiostoma macrostomum CBS 122681]|uniref:DNA-directed RNA polymerase n=1 Tax=Lophiostoma macrostomum CBS 122681 TaxID=1314788 RepID=A0A6A6TIU7_9PLEO|nr:DNA-directed RNA polymerase mitochondrial precursor [Lophiostoma macrostomum CBS 122681]